MRVDANRLDSELAEDCRWLDEAFAVQNIESLLVDDARLFLELIEVLAGPYSPRLDRLLSRAFRLDRTVRNQGIAPRDPSRRALDDGLSTDAIAAHGAASSPDGYSVLLSLLITRRARLRRRALG